MNVARAALLLALCAGVGCTSARWVTVEPTGGTVAIPRNTPEYREEALQAIQGKYPQGYVIDHEEEAVAPRVTSRFDTGEPRSEDAPCNKPINYDNYATQSTSRQYGGWHDHNEWRITFHAKEPAKPQ